MSYSALIQLTGALEDVSREVEALQTGDDPGPCFEALESLSDDLQRFGRPELYCVWHLRRSRLLLLAQQAEAALEDARAGRAVLGGMRKGDLEVDALVAEARALDAMGAYTTLNNVCEQGIQIVEGFRYKATGPYLKAGYMRNRIALYALGVLAAFKAGDLDRVIARAELSKCRLDQHRETSESAAQRQELRSVSARISELEAAGRTTANLRTKRRMLWDRYAESSQNDPLPPVTSVAQAQAALGSDEAVLYHYWIDKSRLLRLCLSRTRAEADLVEVTAAQRKAMQDYIARLSDETHRGPRRAEDIADFAQIIWPPAGPQTSPRSGKLADTLAAASRLILSPHRLLHRMPFAALPHGDGYVLHNWSLRYSPSLAALTLPPQTRGQRRALCLGVETYGGVHAKYRRLKGASREAEDIAALYAEAGWHSETLSEETSEADLLSAIERHDPDVLHIACHADNVAADTPLESKLILARETVDGLDIALSSLAAHTVMLSACSTGQRAIAGRRMGELPGDDLHGLQTAFFASGARNVVANLFPVKNHAAQQIAPAFHRGLLSGHPPDVALTQAIRDYIANTFGDFAKPDYWAPFFVVALGPAPAASQQDHTQGVKP
ncbi:CHAT domain-containing protein [Primorskyibacter sp. S187A]|uniref:CHAT domain-containing protein n=1 Tax=Primorskyibacter sp. S187A TaxID=3415130 RepID=UPI003C7DDD2F